MRASKRAPGKENQFFSPCAAFEAVTAKNVLKPYRLGFLYLMKAARNVCFLTERRNNMQKRLLNVAEYLLIAAMGVLFAFNYILFIVPNGFAPAGINGIAVMIQYKLNFSVAYMSLLINVPLCVAAYFYVDRTFAKKSLFFCIVYSAAYLLLQNAKGIERFCYNANNVDTIYPVIIAGLLGGFVYGVLFKGNACTGGTDIVARIVAKKEPRLNFFWVTFILNTVVAAASYFVYSEDVDGVTVYNMKPVCLCLFYCFLSSFVGSMMLKESKSACQFIIITNHSDEIEKEITEVLHHSATKLYGKGVYSGGDKTVLMCLVNKHQQVEFERIIAKYPDTFSIEQSVIGTIGNFKKIKW